MGSDLMAGQSKIFNLLRLVSLFSPDGRHRSLLHHWNWRTSRDLRRERASSCSLVKHSTSSLNSKDNSVREEERRRQMGAVRTPAMSSVSSACSFGKGSSCSPCSSRAGSQSAKNLGVWRTYNAVSWPWVRRRNRPSHLISSPKYLMLKFSREVRLERSTSVSMPSIGSRSKRRCREDGKGQQEERSEALYADRKQLCISILLRERMACRPPPPPVS